MAIGSVVGRLIVHNALKLGLEPLDGILLGDTVLHSHLSQTLPPPSHTVAGAFQDNIEIHACKLVSNLRLNNLAAELFVTLCNSSDWCCYALGEGLLWQKRHSIKGTQFEQLLTVNACRGVILDTQINVLIDAKPKVARLREVASQQLILLHLQSSLLQSISHENY